MNFYSATPKFLPHQSHTLQGNAELFIVEGDSALASVSAVRNPMTQAVLTMQGKPLNAIKASPSKVFANVLYKRLQEVLSVEMLDEVAQAQLMGADRLLKLPYKKIILLFDPDADGIHCGALMQMFFYRWMRPLIENGFVDSVHFSLEEIKAHRPRGLGSVDPEKLRAECMFPETRLTRPVTIQSARACLAVFGA